MTEEKQVSFLGLFIWLLVSFFFLYEFFLRTFIGSIANEVMDGLSLSAEKFAWITSAYYFSYAIMQVPVGMLVDKFGVRKILIFGTLVCALSAFFFAHSSNFETAFVSRLIMGFGSSFAFISLLVVASNWFPQRLFGFFVGSSQFIGTMGPILAAGPMVKFLLTFNLSWQKLLDGTGVVGFILALVMFIFVKNKTRDGKKITIYLRRERPFSHYLKLLIRNPQVWYIAIYSGIIYTAITLIGGIWGAPYLQAWGFSHYQSANAVSLSWLGYAIGCIAFGFLSDKFERRRPVLILSALACIGLLVSMLMLPKQPLSFYMVVFFLVGLTSAGQTVAFAAIAENVDFATKATALGLNNAAITALSSILPVITGYLINHNNTGLNRDFLPTDFYTSFMLIAVLCIPACVIAVFYIKETFCKLQKEPIFLKVDY